ncbi:MAG: hypothetical protein JRC86_11230, partial [Deltaproteobacteria bacterium]|nr:hypothetical protein [Deltaproteobacteria bacterium]
MGGRFGQESTFALKHFDLSFAYAIWAGLGILLVSVMGMT